MLTYRGSTEAGMCEIAVSKPVPVLHVVIPCAAFAEHVTRSEVCRAQLQPVFGIPIVILDEAKSVTSDRVRFQHPLDFFNEGTAPRHVWNVVILLPHGAGRRYRSIVHDDPLNGLKRLSRHVLFAQSKRFRPSAGTG